MSLTRSTATNKLWRLLILVGLATILVILASCSATANRSPNQPAVTFTIAFPGPTRTPTAIQRSPQASEHEDREVSNNDTPTVVIITPGPGNDPILLPSPTANVPGIRPGDAQFYYEPESGPDLPDEMRPPPVSVPHAIHPDDHYWLARPLGSNSRSYDLEYYHYANRPMILSAWPYRVHHGMDFPNKTGTPIFAASSGTVIWAGSLPNYADGVNYYGNTVIIKHDWQWLGQDVYTLYAHTLELFVKVGDYVDQGQLIAGVGASGEVSGPHLHLEVRVGDNTYQSTRNPALWLAPYEGWGTLAGRFIDQSGQLIHGALIAVYPVEIENGFEIPIQRQRTYEPATINSDDVWQENFVVSDLPAGEYQLVAVTAGTTFRRTVHIRPGQTNYVLIQADFNWAPTPVPTLTPTATPTPSETPQASG